MDGARVIPLHADAPSALRRARSLARRRARPLPAGSGDVVALPAVAQAAAELAVVRPPGWEQRAAEALAFLRRRLRGDYAVDEFGFDADLTEHAVLPLFRPLYEKWFRVEVNGVENIPDPGGALLVANHAGGLWALDAAMTAVAVHVEHPAGRYLRMLGADLLFSLPGVGSLARKTGSTLACADDAERLLAGGELVGVWPEGFKGIGKPFRERYKLQRFGRGGFVRAAIKSGVPIIPVSIVGAEEIHPVLGNARTLARLFNLPYFPLTPTFPWLGPLGLVPLPSKWYIEFGAPIHTEALAPEAAEDTAVVFDLADRVRETIQNTLYRLLVQRASVWR
jgi:1-acyl-sn-glycerol-3-phosphate acyltransferase